MPAWLHKQLASDAKKKGLKGKRFKAYVYGTMQKIMKEAHAKGESMPHKPSGK